VVEVGLVYVIRLPLLIIVADIMMNIISSIVVITISITVLVVIIVIIIDVVITAVVSIVATLIDEGLCNSWKVGDKGGVIRWVQNMAQPGPALEMQAIMVRRVMQQSLGHCM